MRDQGRSLLTTILISFVALTTAHAAQAKHHAQKAEAEAPAEVADASPLEATPLYTDESFNEQMKNAKSEKPRSVATLDVSRCDSKMPADFIAMRTELIGDGQQKGTQKGIQTPEQLDVFIKKYSDSARLTSMSPEAQLLALQMKSLAPYKSIVFRTKEYVGKYAAIRVMIVSLLRGQAAAVQAFYPVSANDPTNRWDVIYKYMTEPQPGMGAPVETDAALLTLVQQLSRSQTLLTNDLSAFIKAHQSVWWDNRVYAPFASFVSDQDRCVHLTAPELNSIYATASLASSSLSAASAYSLAGLQASIHDLGKLIGIDTVDVIGTLSGGMLGGGSNGPQGISSMSRIKVLRKHPQLFSKVADGDVRMRIAFTQLVDAARSAQLSFEQTKRLPAGQDNLFDPRVALGLNRPVESSFIGITDVLTGKDVESTVVNGEKIRVNISGFYHNPPANLQELFPVDWVKGPEYYSVTAWGRKTQLRNYKYGMATEWNVAPYRTLFPDITSRDGRTTADIPKFARVLSQTWGAAAFALPLGAVIF